MPQDAFTLRFLCDELNTVFVGGKVNRITAPENDVMFFTVYTGSGTKKFFIDVNPSAPRIGVGGNEGKGNDASNFCMLVRKHLLSATVQKISLVGFDRIVKIDFLTSPEFFDSKEVVMYVELMGRYSNMVLTENGKILGGNRGINMFDDGVRPLFVGKEYVFPPVGDKKIPLDEALYDYFKSYDGDENGLSSFVVSGVQGVAKSTADELVTEYYKSTSVYDAVGFCDFLKTFLYKSEKNPCVEVTDGTIKDVYVFPYASAKGELICFDKLYLAEEYYFETRRNKLKFDRLKERINGTVAAAIKKANKKLNIVASKEKEAACAEQNKKFGELVLSNIYKIKQGDESCAVFDYYDEKEIVITLDKKSTPAENAEKYYKRYNKLKRTAAALVPQREQLVGELNYLKSVADFASSAEDYEVLDGIREELEEYGLLKKAARPAKTKKVYGYRCYEVDGYTVKVGRNNKENEEVTFSAAPDDVWLHVKDYPSSHVVISTGGKGVSDEVLKIAAEICAYGSTARGGGKIEVVYTKRANVKKQRGKKIGSVTYTDYSSIFVVAAKHDELLKNGDGSLFDK